MVGREIIFSEDFDYAVQEVGGYWVVDRALEAVLDGLRLNPYGFPKFENDNYSFRYVITSRIGEIPALIFTFTIDANRNVVLQHVERHEPY